MVAVPSLIEQDDNYCPNCGDWYFDSEFNHDEGWCNSCLNSRRQVCTRCSQPTDGYRTTCQACRLEMWYEKYADEVELLIVTKGYSVSLARQVVSNMVRPICQCCKKPIKGGTPGESLFCKSNKKCHSMYNRYRRLLRKGKSPIEALREVTDGSSGITT